VIHFEFIIPQFWTELLIESVTMCKPMLLYPVSDVDLQPALSCSLLVEELKFLSRSLWMLGNNHYL
jgi:hypothetical protein